MEVSEGDMLVAYLSRNTFYATGRVIAPRRTATGTDTADTIGDYVQRHVAYGAGYVYFNDAVAYENHTDLWRHPERRAAFPVRIDVDCWEDHVQAGVEVSVVNEIQLRERQFAIFELTEQQFNRIVTRLRMHEHDPDQPRFAQAAFRSDACDTTPPNPQLVKTAAHNHPPMAGWLCGGTNGSERFRVVIRFDVFRFFVR